MYKKVWCTCEVVVLLIKPIAFFFTFSLPSASLDLKVPIRELSDARQPEVRSSPLLYALTLRNLY